MHAEYSCFPADVNRPHSEFISLCSKCRVLVAEAIFFCTCVLKDILVSNQISSQRTVLEGWMMMLFDSVTVDFDLFPFWKWIKSVLLSLKVTALSFAHWKAGLMTNFRVLLFSLAVLPFTTIAKKLIDNQHQCDWTEVIKKHFDWFFKTWLKLCYFPKELCKFSKFCYTFHHMSINCHSLYSCMHRMKNK